MKSLKVCGVILKIKNYGEADKVITVYTRERGKLHCLAKGARRIKSKFAGYLQVTNFLNLYLVKGKRNFIITAVETVENFLSTKSDLKKIAYSLYLLEIVDSIVGEEDKNKELFLLLWTTLKEMSKLNTNHNYEEILLREFEWKALSLCGYQPSLDRCAICNKSLEDSQDANIKLVNTKIREIFLNLQRGSIICADCQERKKESAIKIYPETLRFIKSALNFKEKGGSSYKMFTIPRDRLNPEVLKNIAWVSDIYLKFFTEVDLKSAQFLEKIQQFKEEGNESKMV